MPEKWMMGVTSLEVYNTINNITEKNNKIKFLGTEKDYSQLTPIIPIKY